MGGEIMRAADVKIAALSSAALYGKGVFTTIAIRESEPILWSYHWQRLNSHCSLVGIDASGLVEQEIKNELSELVEKNEVSSGKARITVFDQSLGGAWPSETPAGTECLIMTGDSGNAVESFRLGISARPLNSASPLARVKSCNYLERIIALDESRSRGLHEAIRLNENGEIVSACMANVFWLKDDMLFTPSPETGCLAGTTRRYVMENLDCFRVEKGLDALNAADEIFLSSAGLGVVQVAEFQGRTFERSDHAILDLVPTPR